MDRKNILGATDAVRICGISSWGNALDVYEEKMGIKEQFSGTEHTEMGHYQEEVIKKLLQEKALNDIGAMIVDANALVFGGLYDVSLCTRLENTEGTRFENAFKHTKYPFLTGTPDDFIVFEDGSVAILECKHTQTKGIQEPLQSWVAQTNYYMGMMGIKKGYIAWLARGVYFNYAVIDFDEAMYNDMVYKTIVFHNECLLKGVSPVDHPLFNIKDKNDNSEGVEVGFEEYELFKKYAELNELIKQLEDDKSEVRQQIEAKYMSVPKIMFCGNKIAGFSKTKGRDSIDLALIKKDFPNDWQRFMKSGGDFYTFRISI